MGRIFNFDKMITPIMIKILFWIGILVAVLSGFFMIGFGIVSKNSSYTPIIFGLISLFLGPIIIRVYCEILIIIFKMQESVVQILDYFLIEHKNNQLTNREPYKGTD